VRRTLLVSVVAILGCLLAGSVLAATIVGSPRNDSLRGTAKSDRIDGMAGNDRLYGLRGKDVLIGGAGNDLLVGGAGADNLNCGPGKDAAKADDLDKVSPTCESVKGLTPPSISIADASVAEGNAGAATLSFSVTLSKAAKKRASVRFATADGTAAAPGDYASATGTITFAPSQTNKSIDVAVVGDNAFEPDETFTVGLSEAVNGTIARRSASGTITNDDPRWDPAADWRDYPDQANPSPDSYGNAGVWSYRASADLTHSPADYALLPQYSASGGAWVFPGYINLLIRHAGPSVVMHSYGGRCCDAGRMSVLAWTSPMNGVVKIMGTVTLPDIAACNPIPFGDPGGIIWSVEKGSASLSSTGIPAGGSINFDVSSMVQKSETLFFIHDPGYDSHCDSALLSLSITRLG